MMADMIDMYELKLVDGAEATVFDVNGAEGYYLPLANLTYDYENGTYAKGCGFLFVTDAKDDVGVYISVGLIKNADFNNFSERDGLILNMLTGCSLSMTQSGEKLDDDYVVWKDRMPDGTGVTVVYVNGEIKDIVKITDGNGVEFFYNDQKEGYFLLKHFTPTTAVATADEYMTALLDAITSDEIEVSDVQDFEGRMTYRWVALWYTKDDKDYCEEIFVSRDDNGDIWLLDLYGLEEDVDAQEDNLLNMLWSIHEHWDY